MDVTQPVEKTSIFGKLTTSPDLRHIAEKFSMDGICEDAIGNAAIRFFQILHYKYFTAN